MFDFRRITLFCLGYPFSKHKMIICSKIWGARPPRFPLASTMDKTDRGESFYKRIGLADHNRYVRRQ